MHTVSFDIPALGQAGQAQIQQRIDQKTKPPGALGALEVLAAQLAQIQQLDGGDEEIRITRPTMLVFAADHGIARHPVSIAPQAVTRQMVLNFLAGGAAINCFCQSSDMALQVIDAGVIQPLDADHRSLLRRRVGPGSADFSAQPAMTAEQYQRALYLGADVAREVIAQGSNVLGLGEMGIGNTSSASALLALAENLAVEQVIGRGTGINDDQLLLKSELVGRGVQRVRAAYADASPAVALQEVGGFEIVQIVGAILAAAAQRTVILVDGFIVTVAALLACRMEPGCRDYMVFCHHSAEPAHRLALQALEANPLLDLGLRLGEGTGAALALPLLRAAAGFYNQMASFASAGVEV
ncbi:nicotinate-nucleotide--dimethylbenzimidazole phosphoribosyltransferase [Oceanobacter sp. 4_MG-2023]|uniref:nicotinate-nucleotide--dimethylbenzimidazole phosphoribosyltransferase n=1 Tax=Oceanobacter sp. 4_MG-2023 TaxID=3062623 RepID=UPI00273316D2|nr:nicotinate-nucleotide--dimethylbenzimidazole phosphoribosyltransferase [Oceanobacter sp. 4_MG-2023]MDP2548319.1 nicotinate-nucleotide--dimethylbenzimidazole phosphoribosyltransferase [Oceanobacter sp. 4_MG-2023]